MTSRARNAVHRARLEEHVGPLVSRALMTRPASTRSCVRLTTESDRVRRQRDRALKTPSTGTAIKIFGANLSTSLKPGRHRPRPGRARISRVVSAKPDELAIEVDVAANAPIGPRAISVAGTVSPRRWSSTTRSTASRCCRRPAWRASAATCFRSRCSSSRRSASTTGRTGSPTPPDDLEPRPRQRALVDRRIHGDLRRRRLAVRRDAGRDGPVHAERRRTEPEAERQSQQRRRHLGGGGADRRQRHADVENPARARTPAA